MFADESSFLSKSAQFFVRMVDPVNNRFFYECFPPSGERRHLYMPMRDLAAAWDATKILLWNDADHSGGASRVVLLNNQNQKDILRQAVQTTIEAYLPDVAVNDDGGTRISYQGSNHGLCSKLESNIVQDPSNIGDSAMMLLVLVNSQKLGIHLDSVDASRLAEGLVYGILSQQDDTSGAYRISFGVDGDIYKGIEFFPGEAMLALLEVCQFFLQGHNGGINNSELCGMIMESVQRAYVFYSDYYHQRHENDASVNFNIWQIQAHCALCRVLVEIGRLDQACLISTDIILPMTRDIIDSPAWKHSLTRGKSFYGNLKTIEIACGLDAIVDVLEVHDYVVSKQEEHYEDACSSLAVSLEELQMSICNAFDFLNWSQEQVPEDSIGYGGLGFGGVYVPEQRLDVTGHAVSAMYKLILKRRAMQVGK